MAITRSEIQVLWTGSANTDSIAAGGSETSLEFNLDATAIRARITMKADNSTTPAADDQIYFWLVETSGDPDGASTDEFGTAGHATLLAILDTNEEDPALKTVDLPLPQDGCKLIAEGSSAGTTNAITVSAAVTEQKA